MPNPLSRSLFNLFFGSRRKPLEKLPGPQPGVLGTVGDFLGHPPWDVCARYGREYGGITLVWMVGSPALVLNDPALIEEVMITRRLEFEKGAVSEQVRPTVTDYTPFIARQGEDWASKRKVDTFDQPWSQAWMAAQVGPMQAVVAQAVEALLGKSSVDLTPTLRRMTFDVFSVNMVGEKLSDSMFDDFMLLAKGADARIQAKLPLKFVSLPEGFETARERFYGYFIDRVRAARRAPPDPGAVHLLAWTLREQPEIDDLVLAHILGTFFYGGVFSSSTTLVGALHQLQKYPPAEERLAAEAAAVANGTLTFERLRDAPWAEAVAYESLRLLPAVRIFTRMPSADTKLAGVTLPAGTNILISNQHLHRDPSHWPHPETFEPARWLDGGKERDPHGSGWFFPFGRGARACSGGDFAILYLQTALATIAARAKVLVDSTAPFEEGFFFGVVLPKGVTARFISRQEQAVPASPPLSVKSA